MDNTLVFWTGFLTQLEDFIQFINTNLHATHYQPVFDGFLLGEIIPYAKNHNNPDAFLKKIDFFIQKLSARG